MDTCRGKIYYSIKSNLDAKPCSNKAKDPNGFCLQHKKQSQRYRNQKQYEASIGLISVEFKVYLMDEEVIVKMRHHHQIGKSLKDVNEKFGCHNYKYAYNGDLVDLTLPAMIYDNKILNLVPY